MLLEACGSAHHGARQLCSLGHSVHLFPPHAVRSYVPRNKTDRNDEIMPVPVKTIDQQALAALHRLRSRWVGTRTARLNALRRLLRELGLTIPLGAHRVLPRVQANDELHYASPASRRVSFEMFPRPETTSLGGLAPCQ